MRGQTVILASQRQRDLANALIDKAPQGAVVNIKEAGRTNDQNAKMYAMLSDISRSKPQGRCLTPDRWKMVMMQACGHSVQFETGLDGAPFPIGYSSSKLSKAQMADLITFMYQYGDEHGVKWSEPNPYNNHFMIDCDKWKG